MLDFILVPLWISSKDSSSIRWRKLYKEFM